jgi:putative ABC transport system ATP-binding protein
MSRVGKIWRLYSETTEGGTKMNLLTCEGVRKVYGSGGNQVVALDGIDLTVEKGEFTAIMGASGSGKSTLLHILGTVDKPTAGKVYVEGTDLSTLSPTKAAIFRRRKVGLVYQFYNLIPTLTVSKNILMPLTLDNKKPNEAFFDSIVRTLGITDKLETMPNQLSGGQQQRVAIARSLVYRPALLLADEPTGNLDQRNSKEIIDMLKLSNRNLNQTILLITHDERVALEADRIITIEDGRITRDERGGHDGVPHDTRRYDGYITRDERRSHNGVPLDTRGYDGVITHDERKG